MCGTCGCGEGNSITISKPGEGHTHYHNHGDDHGHNHHHQHDDGHHHHHTHDINQKEIQIERDILGRNNLLAERNRGYFEAKNIIAINLVSSPGSGKTSLLERTIKEKSKDFPVFVIEGDQQTLNDANRIKAAGAPVVQVNTGSGCHLDAEMINNAIKQLQVADNALLMIENVGNLVCPSMFDLGETVRVVVISTTEGEDKPIKYPDMFATAQICVINKTDLLPYVDFSVEKCKEYAKQVNPKLKFVEVSVKTGEGMDNWYKELEQLTVIS